MGLKHSIICLLSGVLLISGCIEEQQNQTEPVCNPLYILVGVDCCLDADQNSICDTDETTTIAKKSTTTIEQTTTVMEPKVTTTTEAVVTTSLATTTLKATYGCTDEAGYNPDSFIYVHSDGCGDRFLSHANAASREKEVSLTKLDIDILDTKEIKLLECFYGRYYDGNMEFSYCPRLLCPKTGKIESVDGSKPVSIQMKTFAKNCA